MRRHLSVAPRAWDFLSIALSVVAADAASVRTLSADGWAREYELDVAVGDPDFWGGQALHIEQALAFLTTDRWQLHFHAGGQLPPVPRGSAEPEDDCIALLSGGLDSLVGVIDLAASGLRPMAISQIVRGDAAKQESFAAGVGGGLTHVQFNHNAEAPGLEENSQRARSLAFIAFGVIAATAREWLHSPEPATDGQSAWEFEHSHCPS